MRIIFKSFTKLRLPKKIILLVLVVTILFMQMSKFNLVIRFSHAEGNHKKETRTTNQNLLFIHSAADDTTKPVIKFIQSINNSIVSEATLNIIINITDDNPPLPGNVIIQISNYTNLLFSALMSSTIDYQWIYNWDNLTLYPKQAIYIIRVWAKDSSSNGNNVWSEEFYIYISTPSQETPGILNLILYIIVVAIIFAVISVYINRKIFYKSGKKKREREKGVFKD